MKVYYAHCQAIYGTVQAQRDRELLSKLFYEVIDPEDYQETYANWLGEDDRPHRMLFWLDLARQAEAIAFRALPDGRIPAGIYAEIEDMKCCGKLIIELPSNISSREMTIEQTVEYLTEIGQR